MIKIREMQVGDESFIIELSGRFTEFDMMGWRNPEKMKEAQRKLAIEAVSNKDSDSDVFVVEDEHKRLLGFLYMTKQVDFFTQEPQGYISSIAVSKAGEGKGIGRALMKKAEEWSKNKGYKQLTLNVFSGNKRAIELYSKLNYESEVIKMVKEID